MFSTALLTNRGTTVLGKLEASPYPAPVLPYDPDKNPDPNYLPWHGHITALTVAPRARRLGHATRLTKLLEVESNARGAWFVDLFVRVDNTIAQKLYQRMGFVDTRFTAQLLIHESP